MTTTKWRSPRIARGVARSDGPAPYSFAERLPAELVTELLGYLDQCDLWQAAAVSRAFYASAWHAGLYIHRSSRCALDLVLLREVMQHVLHHDLRLSLSFAAFFVGPPSLEQLSKALEVHSTITRALPVLVSLSLPVDKSFGFLIDDALCHPAPRLQELDLSRRSDASQSIYLVPGDMFSGFAPRLHRLTLSNVSLGTVPVPAFSRVNDSALDFDSFFPDVNFSRHFPCLHTLRLSFDPGSAISPQLPCFEFGAVSLRKLVIENWEEASLIPCIDRCIKLCVIPNLEYGDISVVWTQPIWQQKLDDTLSIRLRIPVTFCPSMSIIIVPEHRNWRRTFHLCECLQSEPCPILDIPGICNRLTYLRMDNLCLCCFLQCDDLALDALRDIQVDFQERETRATMVWPPDWYHTLDEGDVSQVSFEECDRSAPHFIEESYRFVHCRNLETLTLFARDSPTCVESQEVAFLGRALSQIPRPEKERAALTLIGVAFKKPVARALLEQTFSSVRHFKFCGSNSLADKDDGLWDEDI